MNTIKRQAKVAGWIYMSMVPIAPIGLVYAPAKLFVANDPAATAQRIQSHLGLLHAAIATDIIHQLICVFLVLALYRLFKPVNEYLAKQVVIFGALLSVPIMFVNVLSDVAANFLVNGKDYLSAFSSSQLDVLAYMFMHLHLQGLNVASVFWGLWLFPFGLLAIRCGFIPKVFGWLLLLAGAGYTVNAFAALVLPQFAAQVAKFAGPLSAAELPIIFWLAFWGAKAGADVRYPESVA